MQNAEVRVEAILKPPRGHPEATWWPTGRHPEATRRLPLGYPQATPRLRGRAPRAGFAQFTFFELFVRSFRLGLGRVLITIQLPL